MCRSIKTLFNFAPPASEEEVRAACLQFVRKISGFNKPSKFNETAFDNAVRDVQSVAQTLLTSLHTNAPLRNRQDEIAKARVRSAQRFPNNAKSSA